MLVSAEVSPTELSPLDFGWQKYQDTWGSAFGTAESENFVAPGEVLDIYM